MIQRRKYLANMIKDRLKHIDEISFQKVEHSSSHSYHLMPLKITSNKYNRDDFIKYISSKFKIKAIIQYYLLNKYDLFKDYGYNSGETPVAENCFHNILSIPFSPEFSDQNVDYIIESINSTHNYLRE
jgi:dTDP-4-amino-4,6-dideoxygalactose transaminase